MTDSGLQAYTPLLMHLLISVALAGALTAASVLVGWRRPSRAKQLPYECGMEPTGDARAPVRKGRRVGCHVLDYSFLVLHEFAQGGSGSESTDFDIGGTPAGEPGDFLHASFLEFKQSDDQPFLG